MDKVSIPTGYELLEFGNYQIVHNKFHPIKTAGADKAKIYAPNGLIAEFDAQPWVHGGERGTVQLPLPRILYQQNENPAGFYSEYTGDSYVQVELSARDFQFITKVGKEIEVYKFDQWVPEPGLQPNKLKLDLEMLAYGIPGGYQIFARHKKFYEYRKREFYQKTAWEIGTPHTFAREIPATEFVRNQHPVGLMQSILDQLGISDIQKLVPTHENVLAPHLCEFIRNVHNIVAENPENIFDAMQMYKDSFKEINLYDQLIKTRRN